jgi:hypothetical protein
MQWYSLGTSLDGLDGFPYSAVGATATYIANHGIVNIFI